MKFVKPLSLTAFFYLLCSACFGQTRFKATIVDNHSHPIEGAVAVLKGAKGVSVSDSSGEFLVVIPPVRGKATIVIKAEGYCDLEETLDNPDSTYIFHLFRLPAGPPPSPEKLITFPWPPPAYSSEYPIDRSLLSNAKNLKDIDNILSRALNRQGYTFKEYYWLPGGFAIFLRVEQIDEQGMTLPGPDRWSAETVTPGQITWAERLKRIFFSSKGYFRAIVFVVSNEQLENGKLNLTKNDADKWLQSGWASLPIDQGKLSVSDETSCTALIYEFIKPESGDEILKVPGNLPALQHMKNSGLLNALQNK